MSNDGIVVELVQPVEKDSAVGGLLKKTGPAPYHICYLVPSMEEAIKELVDLKFTLMLPPEKTPALENKRVAFLYQRYMGIVELLKK